MLKMCMFMGSMVGRRRLIAQSMCLKHMIFLFLLLLLFKLKIIKTTQKHTHTHIRIQNEKFNLVYVFFSIRGREMKILKIHEMF